jgi:hypothetical protein
MAIHKVIEVISQSDKSCSDRPGQQDREYRVNAHITFEVK